MATLEPNKVPPGSELNMTLHARALLCELTKSPMGECNVIRRAHQPDGQIRIRALALKTSQIDDEGLCCFQNAVDTG